MGLNLGPILGPQNWPKIGSSACINRGQVRGFWHWIDFLKHVAQIHGKEPIFLNLDETSVGLSFLQPPGCVVSKQRWKELAPPTAKVGNTQKRGAVTFCAMITHQTALQPLLPQVILGNRRILSRAFCASLDGKMSPSVHVWAEKSGWMTSALLVKYLNLVADVMDSHLHVQGIVVLDCAPAHLGVEVVEVAKARGLYLCFVPAGCTAHLQPLDVGCFGPCKAFLRRRAREVQMQTGSFTKQDWVAGLNHAATAFLSGRRWKGVFERCGILGNRMNLKGVLGSMALKYYEVEPALAAPSKQVVNGLLPANRRLGHDDLMPA